ncbi:glycoside hydrolase family 18 protein [Rugamonas sp.]|uniref:glycoside hydrolase family 18 protein n=1 Tax=Rugamonas sp. TaxID=1926287 RepID=UPI0025CDB592|nr:glycoside hydrolase family 18 protein [Rugamonas sp.]
MPSRLPSHVSSSAVVRPSRSQSPSPRSSRLLRWLAALPLACVVAAAGAGAPAREIVGYYPGWKSAGFPADAAHIDASQLTVVLFAFLDTCWNGRHGNPNPAAGVVEVCHDAGVGSASNGGSDAAAAPPDGTLVFGDPAHDGASLHALAALKHGHPGLRVLASVGGWNWSNQFSNLAATAPARATFAASALALLRRYDLDGIDIDWEYPTAAGVPCTAAQVCERPDDKQHYVTLVRELRAAFDAAGRADRKHYAITIAAGATDKFIDDPNGSSRWLAQLADSLDWINLMAYDYHMPWDARNGHLAALNGDPQDPAFALGYDDATAVRRYLAAGVAPDKLVLGAPFYGYGWKACPSGAAADGLYQQCGGAADGGIDASASYPFGWLVDAGLLVQGARGDYDVGAHGYRRYWSEAAQAPYLYNAATQVWISYEDQASLRAKSRYINARGLRGAMFWELSGDSGHALGAVLAKELRH